MSIDCGCRPNLVVGPTTLRGMSFLGLFTCARLEPGDFIGLLSGTWLDVDDYCETTSSSLADRYAVVTTYGHVVVPPIDAGQVRPDPLKYPMTMVNEPAFGTVANALLVEFGDVIGLVAGVSIPVGSEIFWFYGEKYAREYKVGLPCERPSVVQSPFDTLARVPVNAKSYMS